MAQLSTPRNPNLDLLDAPTGGTASLPITERLQRQGAVPPAHRERLRISVADRVAFESSCGLDWPWCEKPGILLEDSEVA